MKILLCAQLPLNVYKSFRSAHCPIALCVFFRSKSIGCVTCGYFCQWFGHIFISSKQYSFHDFDQFENVDRIIAVCVQLFSVHNNRLPGQHDKLLIRHTKIACVLMTVHLVDEFITVLKFVQITLAFILCVRMPSKAANNWEKYQKHARIRLNRSAVHIGTFEEHSTLNNWSLSNTWKFLRTRNDHLLISICPKSVRFDLRLAFGRTLNKENATNQKLRVRPKTKPNKTGTQRRINVFVMRLMQNETFTSCSLMSRRTKMHVGDALQSPHSKVVEEETMNWTLCNCLDTWAQ